MQTAGWNSLIRLIFLIVVIVGTILIIFGGKIFTSSEYVISTAQDGTITFKSYFLIAGVALLVLQLFVFLREWYHLFRRELMNVVVLMLSFFLFIFCFAIYESFNQIATTINYVQQRLAESVGTVANTRNRFIAIKVILFLLMIWSVIGMVFSVHKLITALKRTEPLDIDLIYTRIIERLKETNKQSIIDALANSGAGAATGGEVLSMTGRYLAELRQTDPEVYEFLRPEITEYLRYCKLSGVIIK
jgi:hypothetical protein